MILSQAGSYHLKNLGALFAILRFKSNSLFRTVVLRSAFFFGKIETKIWSSNIATIRDSG